MCRPLGQDSRLRILEVLALAHVDEQGYQPEAQFNVLVASPYNVIKASILRSIVWPSGNIILNGNSSKPIVLAPRRHDCRIEGVGLRHATKDPRRGWFDCQRMHQM
jgi:hypothetical protein